MKRPGNPRQFVGSVATSSHLQWQLPKVGINDRSDHVNAGLASKRNLLLNTEYHGTDRYLTVILFSRERGHCFSNTPAPPQTVQACQSGCREAEKRTKTKLVTGYVPQNIEPSSFQTASKRKFCQHDVSWKHIGTCAKANCGLKPVWQQGKPFV